jgi:hypothetical protein
MNKTDTIMGSSIRTSLTIALACVILGLSCKKSSGGDAGSGGGIVRPPVPADTIPSLQTVRGWLTDKNAT